MPDRVREYLIKKWKNDTQEYYGTYNMDYKRYDTKTKKMIDVITKITVKGTKDSILLEAMAEFNKKVRQYQEEYPDNDSYTLNDDPVSLIPISVGSGIVVENQRNRNFSIRRTTNSR
jgi:hypothetical protein